MPLSTTTHGEAWDWNWSVLAAEPSFSTQSAIQPTDTSLEEITASRLWKKMGPVPKIPIKHSITKIATLVFVITEEANNIEKKRNKQRRNKVEEHRNVKCTQPQYLVL